jgi:hypothetical protein
LAGSLAEAMKKGSPSKSVSLASTSIGVAGSSRPTVALSSTATGSSFLK